MSIKSLSENPIVLSLAPAAVLLPGYLLLLLLFPTETETQVESLQEQKLELIAKEIPRAQQRTLANKRKEVAAAMSERQQQLAQLQSQASRMIATGKDPVQHLKTGEQIHQVFAASRLTLVELSGGDDTVRMTRSLDLAGSALKKQVESLSVNGQNGPVGGSSAVSREDLEAQWVLAEQRPSALRDATGRGNEGGELQLVGGYQDMLRGLELLNQECPQVVVSTVGFEKPAAPTRNGPALIWRVRYRIQAELPPADQDEVAEGPVARRESDSRQPIQEGTLAAEPAQNRLAGSTQPGFADRPEPASRGD